MTHPLTDKVCEELKALLEKLETAYTTCFDCGHKYGVYSVGCSSVYESKCGVCGEAKPITETRDFGYFTTGIRKLKLEIQQLITESGNQELIDTFNQMGDN